MNMNTNLNIVYAVFEEAVYRHAYIGIFTTEELAIQAGIKAALNSSDGHHRYSVNKITMNTHTHTSEIEKVEDGRGYYIRGGWIEEPPPLCFIVRQDDRVEKDVMVYLDDQTTQIKTVVYVDSFDNWLESREKENV